MLLLTSYYNSEHVSPENTSTRLTVLPNGTNRETLSVEALAGTYTNDGYGHFTLCAPTSTSHYCDAVLSKFRAVNPTATDKDALFGVWPRIWGNYVHLVRAPHSEDGNRFIMDVTDLYPEGYGQDKTPFESSLLSLENPDGPAAQFVVDGGKVVGFGVFGTIGEETKRQRTGSTVEERAEVWFRRV